jgi:hypothetical protein
MAIRQALRVFGLFILRNSYKVTLAGLYFAALVHVNLWNAGYSTYFKTLLLRCSFPFSPFLPSYHISALLPRVCTFLEHCSLRLVTLGGLHRVGVVYHIHLAGVLDQGDREGARVSLYATGACACGST